MSNSQRRSQRTVTSIKNGETVPDRTLPLFDWRDFLKKYPNTKAVPAWCFEHVPLAKEMREIMGDDYLKIQVKLREEECPEDPYVEGKIVYWIATPIKYFGLMSKIEYDLAEGENQGELFMRYINFMTEAKSIGYTKFRMDTAVTCYPKSFRWVWDAVQANQNVNWSKFMIGHLHSIEKDSIATIFTTGGDFNGKYESDLNVGQPVEALDKSCISQMRVGEVIKLVGGRVHVRYWDSTAKPGEADFVCHERSQTIFPPGWCQTVGHDLSAPSGYVSPILNDEIMMAFMNYDQMPSRNIREGMWLEIVDPLNPSVIAAAQISKVLRYGYIMVTINRSQFSTTKCYHITSPLLLYCDFCKRFDLKLVKPISYYGNPARFCWKRFLNETNGTELVIREFHGEDETEYGVQTNMKLEAVDLMEPSHICMATVSEVKGRLAKISFDGWGDKYDQWMVINSTDLFPMGWCEANEYPLRAPRALMDN